ncbi:S8 family peptidase [Actinokineospora xionganensis]|uniref:S8 family serine peptidase n=1 Tax=Actinokineospora xionganensis TaxID=2684470 RepID=A0ABR7L4I7_9PSEU|nr:S8 family serine peptidase [Actinokineospora xionganensis]MBC6447564.1 S8 family serine peptidase [Actinokineospora xionganensis]
MKRTRPGLGSKAASVLAVAISLSAAGYGYGNAGAEPQAPTGVRSYLVITAPGDINGAVQAVTANGGKVQNSYAPIGVVIAHSAATDFATRMRAVTGVQKVGQTRETDVPATGQTASAAGKDSTARRYLEKQIGADIAAPSEPVEWNMLQMGADKAWAINPGSRAVTVGVLDTGVQGTHEDLRDNFDAANSVSCLYGKPNTTPGAWEPDSYAPAAGHGTSVAGIIAAAKNGKGVVGVAPNVRVASVKVMEPTGYMYAENVVCGLMWSAERGFKVTNHSYYVDPWTFNYPTNPDQDAVTEAVRRAVDHAKSKGTVTVAAAGNNSVNLDSEQGLFLPGDLPNAISVTAANTRKELAYYSNYGLDTVELTAPGGDGYAMVNTTGLNNGYTTFHGTSASSPHAAGVVALLASAHPTATPDQLRSMLLAQAIDTPCPTGDSRCTGTAAKNSHFGEGIANALKAVSDGGNPDPDPTPETTLYTNDFEQGTGWTVNPAATDTATAGRFEVGDPQGTSYSGLVMQPNNTASGVKALVTGAAAGAGVGDHDLDGGATSAGSAPVALPATGTVTLSMSWYLGHLANSAGADYLRVRVVTPTADAVVFEKKTGYYDTAAAWTATKVDLSAWRGQTVRLVVEAADVSGGSLVEAGVDDVRITHRQTA